MSENKQKMLRGELYYAFTPELLNERTRAKHACHKYNTAGEMTRRQRVELWRAIVQDKRSLPSHHFDQAKDDAQLEDEPWVEPPVHIDYGSNLRLAPQVYINHNCTVLDTCLVTIGSRTLVGPNVSFFSATHPLDPAVRNGTAGPEGGAEIHVEEDVWIGGNVVILPGVRIGKGATVGAGSVVTKDVAPFTVVAGNPARFLRKIATNMDPEQSDTTAKDSAVGAEKPMGEAAVALEKGV
ncbi:hypothetical protein MMC30_003206 [Trapelia coarctata]|nr:hypothetical protein [Trapelia coarctata]